MPILIKSQSGQRSVKLVHNGVDKKSDMKAEILEVLKGLTIKLEIKVSDILVAGTNTDEASMPATTMTLNLDDLTGEPPASEREPVHVPSSRQQQQQQQQQQQPVTEEPPPPPTMIKREGNPLELKERRRVIGNESLAANIVINSSITSNYPAMSDGADFGLLSSSRNNLEPMSRQAEQRGTTSATLGGTPTTDEKLRIQQQQVQDMIKASMLATAPTRATGSPVQQVKPAPIIRAPEPVKPSKPHLVRGELKIGSVVSTICVNIVSDQEPVTLFVTYDQKKLVEIIHKIKDIEDAIEAQPLIDRVDIGDIVFGKSNDDDCWYRCMVLSSCGDEVEIYFFDWGYTETVDITRIRRLTELGLGLAKNPACAVKVKFTPESQAFITEVLDCEKRFSMRVESFEKEHDGIYTATILGLLDDC